MEYQRREKTPRMGAVHPMASHIIQRHCISRRETVGHGRYKLLNNNKQNINKLLPSNVLGVNSKTKKKRNREVKQHMKNDKPKALSILPKNFFLPTLVHNHHRFNELSSLRTF